MVSESWGVGADVGFQSLRGALRIQVIRLSGGGTEEAEHNTLSEVLWATIGPMLGTPTSCIMTLRASSWQGPVSPI